jgi:hypothetical protein
LLSAKTIGAAARRSGVNEKTLRRWLAEDEAFRRAVEDARRGLFEAGMNRLQALAVDAVDTLAALLGRDVPPTVRLGAARSVVELGLHQRDADTIMKRLAEVEALHREHGSAPRSSCSDS